MEPIRPEGVQIERGIEDRWIEHINAELSKPWGEDEVVRKVEVSGRFNGQGALVAWVADQYSAVGWVVRAPVTPFNAADKYCGLEFRRPEGSK